jgi:hypothetical protein
MDQIKKEKEDEEKREDIFQQQDKERNRDRTLFDKIRKLKHDEAMDDNANGDGKDSDLEQQKKQFSTLIFA